jgi:predicted RNase H-like nuclease/N-acetylglutamate synthase-like GNAT family acetyltransferase
MRVSLRPYEPADREPCLAVLRSNVPEFAAPHEEEDFARFLDRFAGWGATYEVVLRDGEVVACGGLGYDAAKREAAFCWGLVRRDLHRQGIGTRLALTRLAQLVDREDLDRVGLDTSQRTAPFFARFGFRDDKVTPDGYAPGLHRHDMAIGLDDEARRALRRRLAAWDGACVVGVDGAGSRWVAVSLRAGAVDRVERVDALAELPERFPDALRFAVDVPMRLWPERYRDVDAKLRAHAKGAASSVFDAPPRDALRCNSHASAVAWCRARGLKGFSVQSWGLKDKMLEAEDFVAAVGERALEVHPEASFVTLNGAALDASKRSWNGVMRRRALLAASGVVVPDVLAGDAGEVAVDDVLDAAVAAWSGLRQLRGEATPLQVAGEPAAVWV